MYANRMIILQYDLVLDLLSFLICSPIADKTAITCLKLSDYLFTISAQFQKIHYGEKMVIERETNMHILVH